MEKGKLYQKILTFGCKKCSDFESFNFNYLLQNKSQLVSAWQRRIYINFLVDQTKNDQKKERKIMKKADVAYCDWFFLKLQLRHLLFSLGQCLGTFPSFMERATFLFVNSSFSTPPFKMER